MSMPLSAMKVSLPQHLINPVAKCGNPAAREASNVSPGMGGGRRADTQIPNSWTEPRASRLTKEEPSCTKLQQERQHNIIKILQFNFLILLRGQ